MHFFCCLGRVVFYFLLFGRGRGPRPNSNKKNTTPPKQQKINTPPPLPSVFLFAVWAGVRVHFFAVWAEGGRGGGGGLFCFLLFGRGGVFFLAVWARACLLFFCLGGGRVFFLLVGRVAFFFFAVWAGDGSSVTYRSSWLVFKRPNSKKDQTAKKKHEFPNCNPKPS